MRIVIIIFFNSMRFSAGSRVLRGALIILFF